LATPRRRNLRNSESRVEWRVAGAALGQLSRSARNRYLWVTPIGVGVPRGETQVKTAGYAVSTFLALPFGYTRGFPSGRATDCDITSFRYKNNGLQNLRKN
jgi:hypothetical protein